MISVVCYKKVQDASRTVGGEIYWEGCPDRSRHHIDGWLLSDVIICRRPMYFLECDFVFNLS